MYTNFYSPRSNVMDKRKGFLIGLVIGLLLDFTLLSLAASSWDPDHLCARDGDVCSEWEIRKERVGDQLSSKARSVVYFGQPINTEFRMRDLGRVAAGNLTIILASALIGGAIGSKKSPHGPKEAA